MCSVGKKLLDKPRTKENAIKQLIFLSGKEHIQTSGCSVCYKGKILYSLPVGKIKNENAIKKRNKELCRACVPHIHVVHTNLSQKGIFYFLK